ncbi:MAG TPA: glycosyltransferase family 2 protein [Xanthobacteraceae bacterium]|nr:glycosyltransferase family 2 protein [Xanthobacteraceae bacterium]
MGAGPEISIVLPAHNEAGNISAMAAAIAQQMALIGPYEIIFVDDGSSDGTLPAIRAAARDPAVRYVSFTRNFGHQAALRAGLRHARGHGVILMDADFEHPPELIPKLIAAWRAGAKIVATRREDADAVSVGKRLSSQLYYHLLDRLGDVRIEPGSADFMLLDRAVVDVVNGIGDNDIFLRGLVRWLGFPLTTIPYARGVRQHGASKFSLRRMVELALSGIAAHSVRPLRFAIWLALGFAALGLLFVIYALVSYLFVRHTVAGWSSIIAVIAILGAAQLFVLGIIGEYVGRILRETRKRPSYIVAETEADGLVAQKKLVTTD